MDPSSAIALRFLTRVLALLLFWPAPARGAETNPLMESAKFVIEAEDFDFGGGQHLPAASMMPYRGGAYEGLSAVAGVDYYREAEPNGDVYRSGELPNVSLFARNMPDERDRGLSPDTAIPWVVENNFALGWSAPGQWFNYTRMIPQNGYQVWAAVYLRHDTTVGPGSRLLRVRSNPDSPTAATEELGIFEGTGLEKAGQLVFLPLKNAATGLPVTVMVVAREGAVTLRYEAGSDDLDYLVLVRTVFVDSAAELRPKMYYDDNIWLELCCGGFLLGNLQGTAELNANQTHWEDLPGAQFPYRIPADSPHRFFRLHSAN